MEKWGITAESQITSGVADAAQVDEHQADIVRFGDDQQLVSEVIDYSTWPYDPNTLYREPDYQLAQFEAFTQNAIGDPVSIPDRRMEIVVEKIDPFLDASGSGKYGIAVVYRLTNTSDTIIFLSESTAPTFVLFSPEGVALKSHYDLQGVEPTSEQEYEGRIVYPQDIYNPSMKSMEVAPNTTVTIYRMYDFAGAGTYHLYLSTDKYGNPLDGSVGFTFDLTTA